MPRVSLENLLDVDPRLGAVFSDYDFEDLTYGYFGYVNSEGQWYIVRIYIAEEPFYEYEYTKGTSKYADNWLIKGELTYAYYDVVF